MTEAVIEFELALESVLLYVMLFRALLIGAFTWAGTFTMVGGNTQAVVDPGGLDRVDISNEHSRGLNMTFKIIYENTASNIHVE